jgi:hypothetical protein
MTQLPDAAGAERRAATDCPHCGAIAPVCGEMEHAWDCRHSRAKQYFNDWKTHAAGRIHTFNPRTPITAEARAELLRTALDVERGWAELNARRERAMAAGA